MISFVPYYFEVWLVNMIVGK